MAVFFEKSSRLIELINQMETHHSTCIVNQMIGHHCIRCSEIDHHLLAEINRIVDQYTERGIEPLTYEQVLQSTPQVISPEGVVQGRLMKHFAWIQEIRM